MKTDFLQIIIDGYNFLKTTGMMDAQVSDLELEKGRKRLFGFLKDRFPEEDDRKKIVVVFDSQTKLKLPTRLIVEQIDVRFSKGYVSADEMIMELIRANHVPKRLLVVSSDHEIQVCAQRRKAQFIDSDVWLDRLEQEQLNSPIEPSGNSQTKESWGDTEHWIKEFEDVDIEELSESVDAKKNGDHTVSDTKDLMKESSPEQGRQTEGESTHTNQKEKPDLTIDDSFLSELEKDNIPELDDIFPPGYGEDLLDEE